MTTAADSSSPPSATSPSFAPDQYPIAPARTRVLWTGADQILSTASNIIVTLAVARGFSARDFGAFSLAFAVYIVALGCNRALVIEPVVVQRAHRIDPSDRALIRGMTSCSIWLAAVGSALIASGAMLIGDPYRPSLLALAIVLPILLWQDSFRLLALIAGTPRRACVVDSAWLAAALALVPLAVRYSTDGRVVPLLAWGSAAALGGLAGCRLWRVAPTALNPFRWVRTNLDLGGRFLVEFLTSTAVSQGLTLVLSILVGVVAVAGYQGALSAMAPVNFLFGSVFLFASPEAVRLARRSRRELVRFAFGMTAALAVLPLVWLLATRLVSDQIGRMFFGDSWPAIFDMLPAVAVLMTASTLLVGPILVLRTLAQAQSSMRVRLLAGPLILGFTILGCVTLSPSWAVTLGACGYVVVLPYSLVLIRRSLRDRPRVAKARRLGLALRLPGSAQP